MKIDTLVPKEVKGPSLTYNRFLDHDGNEVDTSKYEGMIVYGDSMEPKNIHQDDLILVEKISMFEYSSLELPANCVFHKGAKYEEMPNNHSGFIICDALARVNIFEDSIGNAIDYIINSDPFQKYRTDIRYVSDDFIKTHFKPDKRYPNITIYPHLNYDNKWKLEWVDSTQIYGIVKYGYTFKKNI